MSIILIYVDEINEFSYFEVLPACDPTIVCFLFVGCQFHSMRIYLVRFRNDVLCVRESNII